MTPDLMRSLVRSGANLVVYGAPSHLLRELVQLAVESGSHITFRHRMPPALAQELASAGGSRVTFDPQG